MGGTRSTHAEPHERVRISLLTTLLAAALVVITATTDCDSFAVSLATTAHSPVSNVDALASTISRSVTSPSASS